MNKETFPQSTPEGNFPLTPNYDDISTISVQEPKPELADKMGEGRQDLATSARDAEGHIQDPGSWLMLGYNKEGREIELGDYVSAEQLAESIEKEIERLGDVKIVSYDPPVEFSDVSSAIQEMFSEAMDGHSSIKLVPDSSMPNHNAHGTEIRSASGDTFKSSNILLKNEVQLPDGDYIHRPALNETMGNYGVVRENNHDNQQTITTYKEEE